MRIATTTNGRQRRKCEPSSKCLISFTSRLGCSLLLSSILALSTKVTAFVPLSTQSPPVTERPVLNIHSSSSSSLIPTIRKLGSNNRLAKSRLLLTKEEQDEIDELSDGVLTDESFADRYGSALPDWLLQKCTECGWIYPTKIQQRALDAILLEKQDAVVQAQTGSGKTLTFLLPVLASIDPSRSAVQALIVVPTRELGLQVARVAKRLASASTVEGTMDKIMVMSVLQGSQNRRQRAWAWAEPPHIVIGTPQELCNMVTLGGIKRYNSVKFVVVDEVDACLLNNAGSLTSNLASSTLNELLSKYLSPTFDDGSSAELSSDSLRTTTNTRPVSTVRQTIFCSATIPQHRHFLKLCVQEKWTLQEPAHICLRSGEQHIPPTLEHAYLVCSTQEKKLAALRRVLDKLLAKSSETPKKVLIFSDSRRPLEEMAQSLAKGVANGGGVYWTDKFGAKSASDIQAIFSVLRFEDSLSKRAVAIDSFRGESSFTTDSLQQTIGTGSGVNDSERNEPKLRVLFSTDLAARGLDIADITHVIHFDLPPDADTYVHRAGRAGRMGRKGQVMAIITPEQEFVLKRLTNKLNVDTKCLGRQQVKEQKKDKVMEE
jgi:superfamily II DNA/RNA helicase